MLIPCENLEDCNIQKKRGVDFGEMQIEEKNVFINMFIVKKKKRNTYHIRKEIVVLYEKRLLKRLLETKYG